MVEVIEFQTQAVENPAHWEPQVRFVLTEDRVEVLSQDDETTRSEVGAILDEMYDETLLKPEDGRRFLAAVSIWDDGTRYARVTKPTTMTREAAFDISALVSADLDSNQADDANDEVIELVGQVQRDLAGLPALAAR